MLCVGVVIHGSPSTPKNGTAPFSRPSSVDQRPEAGTARDDERDPYGRRGVGLGAVTRSTYLGDSTAGSSAYRWTVGLGGEPDLSKPYAQHPWVYACVAALSRAASSVPARFDRHLSSGEWEQDQKSALASSLALPNPLQSQRKFFKALAVNHLLYGETFILLLKRADGRMVPVDAVNGGHGMMSRIEQPEEYWPVRGDLVDAVLDPVTKLPAAWRFAASGGHIEYPAHAVVQVAEVNPYNPLRGMGAMQAAYRTAAKDFIIDRYDEALLQNGGSPGGVLSVSGPLTDADQRAIRESWQEAHGRPESHRKTAVLPQGTEYKEIGMSPQAMEHEKLREWDRQTILSIFGVPPVVLGLETINYATAREQNRIFWETSVLPYLDFLCDELQHKLVGRINSPDSELRLSFDISGVSALREDMNAKVDRALKIYTEGHRSFKESASLSGWDISEEALEGSDDRWVPSTLLPADVAASLTTPMGSPSEEPRSAKSLDLDLPGEDQAPLPEALQETREWPDHMNTEDERVAYWREYSARDEDVIARVQKRTARVYREMLLSIRKTLKEIAGKKEVSSRSFSFQTKAFTDAELERLLGVNLLEWSEMLAGQITHILKDSQVSAAGALASELGLAATISTVEDPFILAFYADFPVYLSEGATSNLALDVRSSILRAVSEAEIGSVNSLREAIRLTLRETLGAVDGVMGGLDARADRIARTETIKANNGARTEEMKNNGIEKHIWLSSRDSAVRDSHQSLDGDEVEVGQPFSNGLAFPGDHATSGQRPAAEVVNCRCTTIPVVKQESQ